MNVKLAKTAGFCYGVERAVNAVYDKLSAEHGKIYTYGPIVHNENVVSELKEKGVGIIEGIEELREACKNGGLKESTVIIRAHGVGNDVMELLNDRKNSINVIDATCPFVKKIHDIVKEHYSSGEKIIVTGTLTHPEVMGILGQINNDAIVVESIEEAKSLSLSNDDKYCIVSQTTFNLQKFQEIIEFFREKLYYVNVVNTICNATQLRQKEAYELSRECDAMIVIGGKNSSNTAKLYDICHKACAATYYIGSIEDFDEVFDSSVHCVGITAGASTPKTIIQEVLKYVRDEF